VAGDWARRAPLLPALIFMILVTQLPFVFTLIISFMNWNAYYPDQIGFAGLANYGAVFTDPDTLSAIWTTVIYTVSIVLLSLVIGFGVALLLDRAFLGRGVVRTLMITPFLIMPVAAFLVWKHALYNPNYGLFNGLLRLVFGPNAVQPDWISDWPKTSIVVSLVWEWTPFMMLILLAGLQSQPGDVLEAAKIDRADGIQTFRFITLPHLRQYIELSALLGSIYVLQTFDAIYTITQGGPGSATTNLPYEIYLTMFRKYEYGQAAAAGVVVVVGSIVVATFALRTISSLFTEEGNR
jgi:sorbitol/mannitol transport system permease protein